MQRVQAAEAEGITAVTDSRPKNLAGALLEFLKARGLGDEQATEVLAEVITHSPGYSGKWSAEPLSVTADTRQQLIERLQSSETLRGAIRRLGHDPDEHSALIQRRDPHEIG